MPLLVDDVVELGLDLVVDAAEVVLWGGVSMEQVEAFSITQEGVDALDESGSESSGSVVLRADLPKEP